MNPIQFNEAHPGFSAYIVMGGFDYEGENSLSTRLFDSKQLALNYAEELLKEYDYAQMSIISNDGTIWKMPGSTQKYRLENGKVTNIEVVVAY
jgi:hypothetical protein